MVLNNSYINVRENFIVLERYVCAGTGHVCSINTILNDPNNKYILKRGIWELCVNTPAKVLKCNTQIKLSPQNKMLRIYIFYFVSNEYI